MNQVHLLKYIPQNLLINKPNLSLHLYNERENVINWGYYSFWYWLLLFHISNFIFPLIYALVVNIYWALFRWMKINSLKMKQKYNGFCIIKFGFKISKCVIKLFSLDNFIKYTSPISEELDMYLPVLFQNIGSMVQLNREEVGHKYMLFFLKKWIWLGKLETNLKKSFYI